MITAHFGLAPADFDLFLGLYSYLKKLPELPADGRSYFTIDFIARQLQLPATCAKDYQRLRSRLFRLSYLKYTNSAFWNPQEREYVIANFGFFNLAALSRLAVSRRPVAIEWDRSLLRIAERAPFLTFDYDFYRTLSPALRRLYLIANRDGWNQPHSSVFLADAFTIHQIGYSEKPSLSRLRLQKLKKLLHDAQELDIIRPYPERTERRLDEIEACEGRVFGALRAGRSRHAGRIRAAALFWQQNEQTMCSLKTECRRER